MTIYSTNQQVIAESIDPTTLYSNWNDWHWHISHAISDISTVENLLNIKFLPEEREKIEDTIRIFPMRITPYYLSLIKAEDYANDPVFMQAFPSVSELIHERCDMEDPLAEDMDSPAPCITHRYPDRVLFLVSNVCAMYCRHCTRKRQVGDVDSIPSKSDLKEGLAYIADHPEIRDVLLSGGDPLMLPDEMLDWILSEIQKIPHVEVIRIGSRVPVVLPYRITDDLVSILKRHNPLYLNTHFNHPREVTASSKEALRKLADGGIPLGNQSVLLAGVNDCPRIMKRLVHKMVQNRVKPYYMYQCDLSKGLAHFRTPVGKGIEIIESLIGHTSGFAVPTYVIDAPGGAGKIPIMPNYLISWSTNKVVLRNYEGVISTYQEPDNYEQVYCDRNCEACTLQLLLDDADESKAVGIEKLLSDYNQTITLVPEDNDRIGRRDDN